MARIVKKIKLTGSVDNLLKTGWPRKLNEKFACVIKIMEFTIPLVPREARLINLLGRAGPSGAKPREFERKIYLYICMYVCMFIYFVEGVRTVA